MLARSLIFSAAKISLATFSVVAASGYVSAHSAADGNSVGGAVSVEAAGKSSSEGEVAAKVALAEQSLRPNVRRLSMETPSRWTIAERMEYHGVPGVSIALIQDHKVVWAKGYGVRRAGGKDEVDTQTVFSVGSLSKVGAATAALRLVNNGTFDLDRSVNETLKGWKVPSNEFGDGSGVNLRRLLSHTAGLSVHGFADFKPGEKLPSTVDILNGAGAAKNSAVELIYTPGTSSAYSGGGTTVVQLAVEEAMASSFDDAVSQLVFDPLGMERSSYENPLPAEHGNIAYAHDQKGRLTAKPRGWHAFPEAGASGLWTTPTDYAKMLIALAGSYHGKTEFLDQGLARQALTPVGGSPHGIGPRIRGTGEARRFAHTGANESYRAVFEYYVETGNGLIIFTNGEGGGALWSEIFNGFADAFDFPGHDGTVEIVIPQPAKAMSAFEGRFRAPEELTQSAQRALFSLPRAYRFTQKDGQLLMARDRLSDGGIVRSETSPLVPIAPGLFSSTGGGIELEFVSTNPKAGVNTVLFKRNGGVVTLSRR
ncbi:MAG: serine hydrolase domain-containing protein [Pseudomonadota bacterium]